MSCSGTGAVEEEHCSYYRRDERKYVEYYKPCFFHPALNIFTISEKTPDNIRGSICSSFSLVFTNISSSANQVRISIECLLTYLVPVLPLSSSLSKFSNCKSTCAFSIIDAGRWSCGFSKSSLP